MAKRRFLRKLREMNFLAAGLFIGTFAGCGVNLISLDLANLKNAPPALVVNPEAFNPVGTGIGSNVQALQVDSTNHVVVGGEFTDYNGAPAKYLARLNKDGSLDTSFNQTGSGFNNSIYTVAIDTTTGKIVVGGNFTQYNGVATGMIARLNTDGSLDTSFNLSGAGFDGLPHSLVIASNGKIFVGGEFSHYNGTSVHVLVELNSDGSLNGAFQAAGSGPDNTIYKVALDGSGKVLIAGLFGNVNGTASSAVARVNTDGTLDTSFSVGTGFNAFTTCITSDSLGNVIVGGTFTSFNGTAITRIARLQSNGSIDTTFNVGSGLDQSPMFVVTDTSNQVVATGPFTSLNGTTAKYITRFLSTGAVDTSFAAATSPGANALGFSLAMSSAGYIYMGGGFTAYNSVTESFIAKLKTDGSLFNQ